MRAVGVRSKKRRLDEEADEHHGEFDANALREHEEFTKVKNVEMVELGCHTMETWYFSPLPAEYSNCKARAQARLLGPPHSLLRVLGWAGQSLPQSPQRFTRSRGTTPWRPVLLDAAGGVQVLQSACPGPLARAAPISVFDFLAVQESLCLSL